MKSVNSKTVVSSHLQLHVVSSVPTVSHSAFENLESAETRMEKVNVEAVGLLVLDPVLSGVRGKAFSLVQAFCWKRNC